MGSPGEGAPHHGGRRPPFLGKTFVETGRVGEAGTTAGRVDYAASASRRESQRSITSTSFSVRMGFVM